MADITSAGDAIPPNCEIIEVRVAELRQLFNAIDPSPFNDKDLDPNAEEFIVGWSKEASRDARFALLVHLERPAGLPEEAAALQGAIHEFFSRRAQASRRRLRQLFRLGRTSLVIGLAFLGASIGFGDLVATRMSGSRLAEILRESLLIGGWVAMWRPLEIFLYDWWPIRAEARLLDRLAVMPVQIRYTPGNAAEAWRRDWPAVAAPFVVEGRSVESAKGDSHRHTPEEERDIRESALDDTIASTFPASDPPSSLPNPDYHKA